jgi:HK97 family phage major capsid protein
MSLRPANIRNGSKPGSVSRTIPTPNRCGDFESKSTSLSISGSGGADGGFSVPEILLREVERFERKFSPVRDLVNVVQISSGDVRFLLDVGGTAASWSSETGSRTATTTPGRCNV